MIIGGRAAAASGALTVTAGLIPSVNDEKIFDACRTLFGSHVRVSRNFLLYIQPSGAKSAFRKIAKETHPDLFTSGQPEIQQRQTARFREVMQAYELLSEFFRQREDGRWMPSTRESVRKVDAAEAARASHDRQDIYRGDLPQRPLEIGRYLYYRRSIPYRALIDGLAWQRKQRPDIGTIALQWNWLDAEEVNRIMLHENGTGRFGEKAVQLGLLEPHQVKSMLLLQQSQQEKLGEYFVMRGYLSREELDRLAGEFHRHNAAFRRS